MARTLRVWLQGLAVAAAIFVIAEVHSLGVGLVTGQIKGYDGHTATDGLEWRLQAGSNKYHDNSNLPLDVPRTRELSSLASKGKTPFVDTEASTSGQKTGKKNKKSSDELSSSPTDSSSTQQELQTTGTPTAPRVETTMGKASSSQDAETEQSESTVPATIATENIGSDVTLTGQGSRADKPPSGKSHTTGEMDEADNTKVTPTSLESLADTSEDKSHFKKTTGETNKTTTPPLIDQQSALPSTSTESDTAPSTDKIKKQATSLLPQKHSIQTSTSPSTSSAAGEDDSSPGKSDTSGNGNGNGNGKSNDKSVDNANENGHEHGKKATSTSTPASSAAGEDDSSPGTSATSGNGNGDIDVDSGVFSGRRGR
ncbi:unnamed protein product [Phytophthora lilii]|uniref:Unnamed protein product n=1 Tax=Phytophthora lilii TaxID=2077276 RepID=A0A9W6WSR8_9STRA|nr:unnamed protein product [Phytophthora lilii]